MTNMIVGPPPELWWGRIKKKVTLHPMVTAAIVAGALGLLGLWLGSRLEAPRLRECITKLEAQLVEKETVIRARDVEVQRLETLLTPFRTMALEKFTGSEQEALRQLAGQINALQLSDTQKTAQIKVLSGKLQLAKAEADCA